MKKKNKTKMSGVKSEQSTLWYTQMSEYEMINVVLDCCEICIINATQQKTICVCVCELFQLNHKNLHM